jgi:hypothetical protein
MLFVIVDLSNAIRRHILMVRLSPRTRSPRARAAISFTPNVDAGWP